MGIQKKISPGLSPFAIMCREQRRKRALLMYHQAEALNCTASYVSAVETGNKPTNEEYLEKVITLFELDETEEQSMRAAAEASAKVFKLRPQNVEQAKLVTVLGKRLGDLSLVEIKKLKSILEGESKDA